MFYEFSKEQSETLSVILGIIGKAEKDEKKKEMLLSLSKLIEFPRGNKEGSHIIQIVDDDKRLLLDEFMGKVWRGKFGEGD